MEFDLENPLTGLQEHQSDTIPALFASESDHMPKHFDVSVRQQAISLIHAHLSSNSDPFIPYLAVNYLDRFMSKHGLPQGKQWILKLLSISCLSLAAKMKNIDLSHFHGEQQFIFDSQTVQRMELLILGALEWGLRSVTPFSFIHFFLSLFKLKDPPFLQALKARATEIVFKAQNETRLLEFKPSIIAASALLTASHELFPLQFSCFRNAIFSCVHVNNEKLLDCCNVVEDLMVIDGCDVVSSSNTVVNVLDCNWSSSESEMTTEADIKRRNSNDFRRTQFSQIHNC